MTRCKTSFAVTLAVAMAASVSLGQRPDRREGENRERGFGPPIHPLLMLLDTDRDGELSADEIEKAVAALKRLDKNGDGKLTADEMPRPPFPGRGGPDQFGGPGGPGLPGGDFAQRILDLDKNGDGKISKDEAPERMQEMFARIDTNGDGAIDKEELRQMAARFGGRGGEGGRGGDFVARIMNFDKDGDGKVSREEMPERMQGMLERGDSNGDGAIDKEEAKKMAEQFSERGQRGDQGRRRDEGERPKRPDSL